MKRSAVFGLVLGLGLLAGCHRDIHNKEAVRQGIIEYLSKRTDLMAMDVQVTGLHWQPNGDADALVYLSAKNGSASAGGMEIHYILEQKGNQWVVKGRGGSGNPHGGGAGSMANPHGGSMPSLPPGHPSMTTPAPDDSGPKQ